MHDSLMSRRYWLALTAFTAPLSVLAQPAAQSNSGKKGATFLLVHGAWHGGWCWKKLAPLLQSAGHRVFTPTLTGLGERSHLLNAEVDLETHIKDVLAVLEYEDLHEVILVGHSYGGIVVTGVADRARSRLSQLVYLDAFLPENGKALKDYVGVPRTREDGWRIPPLGPPGMFGVTDEKDVAWVTSRLGDQPRKTFTQPLQLSNSEPQSLPRTYIHCSRAPMFTEAATRAKNQNFRMLELLTAGHDAMITQPGPLAKLLAERV